MLKQVKLYRDQAEAASSLVRSIYPSRPMGHHQPSQYTDGIHTMGHSFFGTRHHGFESTDLVFITPPATGRPTQMADSREPMTQANSVSLTYDKYENESKAQLLKVNSSR